MLSFKEAVNTALASAIPTGTEKVPLLRALYRVLAEDVVSDVAMPPFNKAAMDGFACRKADLNNLLEVIEEIPAGSMPLKKIGINQCSRIMTGAMVPDGADFILMKEHAIENEAGKVRCDKESARTNICYVGEDVKKGDIVLRKGDLLLPSHIAILASVGFINPLVYIMPDVAIISTGNELVEPGQQPALSQIRNSNSYQMAAQTMQLGIGPDYLGIANDDVNSLKSLLNSAIHKYHITLISGGVSVGDYDFVPKILQQLGVEVLFHGMKAKPGKHLLFGKLGENFIFGMPGNPVSSFIQFEVLVKLFIKKLMGSAIETSFFSVPLEENYIRKKADELLFIPVKLTSKGTVKPLEYHGSAHIHSYTKAQGIMEVPAGVSEIKKGELVSVRPL